MRTPRRVRTSPSRTTRTRAASRCTLFANCCSRAMSLPELPMSGGQMTSVVRVGNFVHRTTGPWTPLVHELLCHLERVGFDGATRVRGIDAKGREVLEFIPGEAGFVSATRIAPENLWSEQMLQEAAGLLRRYHDATVSFTLDPLVPWQGPYPDVTPHEVVCHH